jgi:phosphatidylinositol alpha-1,6-mannosyltransferase
MRIGVDVREYQKGVFTGLRTILDDLFRNIPEDRGTELVLFGDESTAFESIPCGSERVVMKGCCTFVTDQVVLPFLLKKKKIDVFYSPYPKTPFYRSCIYVNTICDLTPLYLPKRKFPMSVAERVSFFLTSLTCSARSTLTLTLSEHSRQMIRKIFRLGFYRVVRVYPSVREGSQTDQGIAGRVNGDFILYAGNFKKHKNVKRLIDAYGMLPEDIKSSCRLVLVGGSPGEKKDIDRYVRHRKDGECITVEGNIRRDEVYSLMKKAKLFVFPSLSEGFGLPPVEAIMAGTPVVSSDRAPMTEVLAGAALYFNPLETDDISLKIRRLLEDKGLRKELLSRGRELLERYEPERLGREIFSWIKKAGTPQDLFISTEYPPMSGGISSHLSNLWKNQPFNSSLVLSYGSEKDGVRDDGGNLIIRKKYPLGPSSRARILRTLFIAVQVLKLGRRWKLRTCHCGQVLSAGISGMLRRMLKGTPYLVYVYSADVLEFSRGMFTSFLLRSIIAGSVRVIANSRFTRDVLISKVHSARNKIIIITPAIDTKPFISGKTREQARRELGVPRDKKVLLTVARLAARKGHATVVDALRKLSERRDDLIYLVVGKGPLRDSLGSYVRERGLAGKVRFEGEVSGEKLADYYKACDVFVMVPELDLGKGDSEGFGVVFLEAGASARPVVAGKTGGVPEAVVDGETGILVDPADPEALERAICRLLNDEEAARRMGEISRKRVGEEFDVRTRSDLLRELNEDTGAG